MSETQPFLHDLQASLPDVRIGLSRAGVTGFEEAIEEVVTESFLVEELAEHIARHIVARQSALRAEVRIEARYPRRRRTPVSQLATQELVTLIGIAAATRERAHRVVGVEAVGINACPCAQGLVRGNAADCLRGAGFG